MLYAKNLRLIAAAGLMGTALFCASPNALGQKTDIGKLSSGGKLKPVQANMDIRKYILNLDVDIANKFIKGNTTVNLQLKNEADTILLDFIQHYNIESIKVDGKTVSFDHKEEKIFIKGTGGDGVKPFSTNNQFPAGNHSIFIAYGGNPPEAVRPPWLGGFTWSKDRSGNDWVSINIQKEGGRMYFPCKDHPSDEPNEGVEMNITIPAGLSVAGPGLLQKTVTKKNKSTYSWKTNYTISNYCILFNIGKYRVFKDSYTTINNNIVPIEYYILEEDSAQAKRVIEAKKRDSKILEKYFGEYPWYKEKIGIAAVPNSGMEHQTMITFDNKFIFTTIGGQDYSGNLFHEYAHEWWANKVTNRDWAHMWIQEGIGTYAEALAMYELGGQEEYNKIIAAHKRGIRFRKPLVGGEELSEDETYAGSDIYTKGSFFMHSLRYVLGDELFLKTLKQLATDPAYTYDNTVTTTDVEQLFSKAAGYSLKPFFDFHLRTTQLIEVSIKETGYQQYQIKPLNYFMDLPFEITLNGKATRMILGKDGITVKSNSIPMVDAAGYYLKKLVIQ
ncbi:M1 family metallopeptidase [Sediminibacterium sp.]|uniref:M1 family metallopeptidase n=1 Tax=Sediminibacterium sp. TaxID=1917865 RepID=UPI003F6ECB4C